MSNAVVDVVQIVLLVLLAALFIGMGISHFLPATKRTMSAMIPPRLRGSGPVSPSALVVFTGCCEIAGGLGLLFPPTRLIAGACLIVFLIAVFPANAYAARNRKRFGRLAVPLLPRLFAQIALCLLIAAVII